MIINFCPFCPKGGATQVSEVEIGVHAVICTECGCTGPIQRYTEGARQSPDRGIELWNTRAAPPQETWQERMARGAPP